MVEGVGGIAAMLTDIWDVSDDLDIRWTLKCPRSFVYSIFGFSFCDVV